MLYSVVSIVEREPWEVWLLDTSQTDRKNCQPVQIAPLSFEKPNPSLDSSKNTSSPQASLSTCFEPAVPVLTMLLMMKTKARLRKYT
jgi:hypothetical protein